MNKLKDKKAAFTLAEVLITLGIIGIVAAMTIPNMITNYQKQQTVTKLKKIYSTLSQAYKLSIADNGDYGAWEKKEDIGADEFFKRYWAPYIKVVQVCDTYQDCGYSENYPWQTLGGDRKNSVAVVDSNNRKTILTIDGILLSIGNNIYVDLNGANKPNIYGKDFFSFSYDEKGIVPGCFNNTKEFIFVRCRNDQDRDGACCGARLVKYDNWEIKKDYPW